MLARLAATFVLALLVSPPALAQNDGVVRVEETEVEGMRERMVLPVGHSAMLLSARVDAQVGSFLAHARFSAA